MSRDAISRRQALLLLALTPKLSGIASAQAAPNPDPSRITVMLEEFPPYSLADGQGRPSGYSVDLARELLARAGLEARFEFSSWPRVMLRARGEPNVLVPAIVRLAEREPLFDWLGQISTRRGMLFRLKSRKDVQPRNLAEAQAFRIGVIKDDVSERELLALGLELGRQLDRCADYPSLLRRFFAGHDQLLALNQQLAPMILKQYHYDPDLIEPVLKFSDSRPSIAVSLATPQPLRQRLHKAWDAMRKDGSAAAIAARYPGITLE